MKRAEVSGVVRGVRFLLRTPLMLLTRRDWRGAERLPAQGGFVLAANHLSHLDPIMLGHWLLDHDLAPHFLVKNGLFEVKPLVGWVVSHAEQIPVYRQTSRARDSLSAATAAIAAGDVVTVYPEGTLTRDPAAWPMTGRTGAVRLALETGAPLVPLAQWGPQQILWPYTKRPRFFPRTTYQVLVGDPVDLSDLAALPRDEDVLRRGTERLMAAITDLLAELRGERPTGPPLDVRTLSRHDRGTSADGTHEGRA